MSEEGGLQIDIKRAQSTVDNTIFSCITISLCSKYTSILLYCCALVLYGNTFQENNYNLSRMQISPSLIRPAQV